MSISGAKNSALPCMAAAILTSETITLHNIPYVRDIITQRRLLEDIGAHVLTPELRTHKISAKHIELFEAVRLARGPSTYIWRDLRNSARKSSWNRAMWWRELRGMADLPAEKFILKRSR